MKLMRADHFILLFMMLSCRTLPTGSALSQIPTSSFVKVPVACDLPGSIGTAEHDGEEVFALTESCLFNNALHTVKIRILSETYQKVLDDGCAGLDTGYGHALALEIDGYKIENVGIKVRGNTSRCNLKRQFKFKFDETSLYSKLNGSVENKTYPSNLDRNFFGLESLSVRSSANDPAMVREKIASDSFAAVGTLASSTVRGPATYRLAPAKLFVSFNRTENEGPEGSFNRLIDGFYYDYKGFYSLAENIDKIFVESRFQSRGKKLKSFALVQADLGLASLDRNDYDPTGWSFTYGNGSKVKTEEQKKTLEAALFSLMDRLDPKTTDDELEAFIDIDGTLNYAVSAVLIGHWDSLMANKNNDFLYNDGKKWQPIGWDLDNTLGANFNIYQALMSDDIYSPARIHPNKLFTTLLAPTRRFRGMFKDRLAKAQAGFFSTEQFDAMVDHWSDVVKADTESWEGYNPERFQDLKNFMSYRRKVDAEQVKP